MQLRLLIIMILLLNGWSTALLANSTLAVEASGQRSFSMERYRAGEKVFKNYCALCHGEHADGESKMTQLYRSMKIQQPSDFTVKFYQHRPSSYLEMIIREGGYANYLSKYMPPFESELSEQKIKDVVYFIKSVSKFSTAKYTSE